MYFLPKMCDHVDSLLKGRKNQSFIAAKNICGGISSRFAFQAPRYYLRESRANANTLNIFIDIARFFAKKRKKYELSFK